MIGRISHDPVLLIAEFEVNGRDISVVIDTGASISVLPENGMILAARNIKLQPANLNVTLADDQIVNLRRKTSLGIKPRGSTKHSQLATFYVTEEAKDVLGHQALLGLNALRLFDIEINVNNKIISVIHQGKVIGKSLHAEGQYQAIIKVDDRFDNIKVTNDVKAIILKHRSVFTDIGPEPIRGKPMRFITTHDKPIHMKSRHSTPEEVIQMKRHIKSLLDQGVIEPTDSGYAANSRIIIKKSGACRLVVNYIPLNVVTIRNSYSLPRITDIFGILQGKRYFTIMDCAQGFYQIEVDQRDRHKTAFSTPVGNFQFRRCPFGARNSCAVFQSEMNRIFADGLYTKCVIYVDDILVFGRDINEHNQNLQWVLDRCKLFNVKIKLEKCHFAQEQVQYLGYVISGDYIKPDKAKLDAWKELDPPRDQKELRSIIGKLNFYSRFITDFSKHQEPLRELYRRNKEFKWTEHHQASYDKLIDAIATAPPQALINRSNDKIIELCVTSNSLEAVCLDKNERLIMCASRFMSTAEANYSEVEKQLLALVLAIESFRLCLQPEKYVVRVPDNSLDKAINKIERSERVEANLLKLPEGHDRFEFVIKESLASSSQGKRLKDHVPQEIYYVDGACIRNGKTDCKASWAVCAEFDRKLELCGLVTDAPSNQTAELTAAIKACEIAKSLGQNEITIVTDNKYLHSAATKWIDKWQNEDWLNHKHKMLVNETLFKQLQQARDGLKIEWVHVRGHTDVVGNIRADALATSVINGKSNELYCAAFHAYDMQDDDEVHELIDEINKGKHHNLIIKDGRVYYVDHKLPEEDQHRIYVPSKSRACLLDLAHDDPCHGGHSGIKSTHAKLIRFWWPRMHHDVEQYIKTCDTCQRFKQPSGPLPGYLKSIPVSTIFENVHIDIVGPIKSTCRGNNRIITATDAMSKWVYAKATQNAKTSDIIEFVEDNIIAIHGKPRVIISDRGPQFISAEWRKFVDDYDIQHNMTTPYHPQSNGIDERVNGTLVKILRAYCDEHQQTWDEKLKWATYCYNTNVHQSTGYSPYQMLHGFDPRSPLRFDAKQTDITQSEVDTIRKQIRETANIRNKKAQARQKLSYDKARRPIIYRVGQLVRVREHVAPGDLSPKLFPKWYGPCVISNVLGDENSTNAVTIVDCCDFKQKTVSVQHIAPYLERDPSCHQTNNQNEESESDESIADDFHTSKYYSDYDEQDPLDASNNDDTITYTNNDMNTSTTSSKRVTFSRIPTSIDANATPPLLSSQPIIPFVYDESNDTTYQPSSSQQPTISSSYSLRPRRINDASRCNKSRRYK